MPRRKPSYRGRMDAILDKLHDLEAQAVYLAENRGAQSVREMGRRREYLSNAALAYAAAVRRGVRA